MNKDKHFKLLDILKKELESKYDFLFTHLNHQEWLRWLELLENIKGFFPDHKPFFSGMKKRYEMWHNKYEVDSVVSNIHYIKTLNTVQIETETIKERKFLQDAKDKLKEAGISFEHNDYSSTINNLNTSVELALKDELDIPQTIKKINTRKIIDICISENIGPTDYLKELTKHIVDISNKVKHNGYSPGKTDCIMAMAAIEEFLKKTPKYPFDLTEEIRKKIFAGI